MRTEEQILKDFKDNGYEILMSSLEFVITDKSGEEITIWVNSKEIELSTFKLITMKEWKLLNELFKIWGWIE